MNVIMHGGNAHIIASTLKEAPKCTPKSSLMKSLVTGSSSSLPNTPPGL